MGKERELKVTVDVERLRKPEEHDPLENAIHDFAILVMARMLENEFQLPYIFANHRNWENGPWKTKSGHPTPDVALAEQEKKRLIAVYEIETNLSLLNTDQIISHIKLLGDTQIELVVPRPKLEYVKRELQQTPIQGFWTYTIDRGWKLTVKKDPENKSKILKAALSSYDVVI